MRVGYLTIFSLAYLFSLGMLGQAPPLKWGKVNKEEWQLQEVSFDPEASAVVLYDYGVARFLRTRLSITYHRRIKILKPDALDLADVSLNYYSKDRVQSISALKAQTLNMEGGKIQKHALAGNEFYDQKHSEEWSSVKFTFPAVSAGSIIEYSYTLNSENVVFLREWEFQHDYPILHSEFRAAIPEYLDYKVFFQGSRLISKYGGSPSSRWVLENIASLKPEPYITTLDDYNERLRFQLVGYYIHNPAVSGPEYKSILTSWKSLSEELWAHTYFGSQIKKRGVAKEILDKLRVSGKKDLEELKTIYQWVAQNINWNDDHQFIADRDMKEVYQSRKGTSAEINLLLIMLLTQAGFKVHPLLLSTRSHGQISKNIPLLSQFNQVIASVELENGEPALLLDATDPLRPYNLVAHADLNGHGLLLIEKEEPQWVDIKPPLSTRSILIALDLRSHGKVLATIQGSFHGYYGVRARAKIQQEKPVLDLDPQITELPKFHFQDLQQAEKPLTVTSDTLNFEISHAGDLLYMKPLLLDLYGENPFKTPNRVYPIDFGSPFKEAFTIILHIPQEYSFEEIPESIAVKLPRDYGKFQYQAETHDDQLRLSILLHISRPVIGYGMYDQLRQFYDILVSKLNSQVVLRRD